MSAVAARLDAGIDIPVYFDENAADPYFWARWATRLSGKLCANFISVLTQRNITAESVRRVAAWSTAAVIAVSVLMTLFTGGLVAHRADQKRDIQVRSNEVRELIQQVESKLSAGRLKQDHLGRLQATSKNFPSIMLAHLSVLTPAQVTLTSVSIARAAQGWQVSLQGQVAGDMRESARLLARFEERLSQPPWQLSLSQSFTETWMQQFEQGKLKQSGKLGFQIAGNFR